MNERAVIKKHSQVVYRALGDAEGGVLLHIETGQYHGLNSTGALVWRLIDGASTLADIIAQLRESLSDVPPRLEEDVAHFLRDLQERNLIYLDRA